jgi:CBS domain-containing protein
MMRDQYRENGPMRRHDFGTTGGRGYGDGESDRGWWDRATDEVSSWFEDDDNQAERRMDDRGRFGNRSQYRDLDDRPGYYENRSGRSRGMRGERAADVMSTDVVRVQPDDSLQHAARMMAGYDCGALPVVDRNNRLIGMITDRDITVRGVAEMRDAGRMPVRAAMTDETFACHVHDSVRECMGTMAEHQVRRIPIVDDYNRVVGIVSQADIARRVGGRGGQWERKAVAEVIREVSEPSNEPYRN